jgi:hypothetical protein
MVTFLKDASTPWFWWEVWCCREILVAKGSRSAKSPLFAPFLIFAKGLKTSNPLVLTESRVQTCFANSVNISEEATELVINSVLVLEIPIIPPWYPLLQRETVFME